MAGYSGTPLPQKLGIKPRSRVALIDAPPGFELDLPDGAELVGSSARKVDVIVWFVKQLGSLEKRLESVAARMQMAGYLWVAWPKKSSGVVTDVSENRVRDVVLPTGLVDNKVCAIDEIWSGLRVVWRLEHRDAKKR